MNKFISKIFLGIFEFLLVFVILGIIMFIAQNYSPRLIVISIICALIFLIGIGILFFKKIQLNKNDEVFSIFALIFGFVTAAFFLYFALAYLQEGIIGLIISFVTWRSAFIGFVGLLLSLKKQKSKLRFLVLVFFLILPTTFLFATQALLDLIFQEKLVEQSYHAFQKDVITRISATRINLSRSTASSLVDGFYINKDTAMLLKNNPNSRIEIEYFKCSGKVNKIKILY